MDNFDEIVEMIADRLGLTGVSRAEFVRYAHLSDTAETDEEFAQLEAQISRATSPALIAAIEIFEDFKISDLTAKILR